MNKEEAEAKMMKDFEWYKKLVDQVARRIFVEHVKPFCRKRRWRFLTGNGAWAFFTPNERMFSDKEDLPNDEEWATICDLLGTGIPGFSGSDLGSLMPEVKDPTYKEES